MFRSERQCPDCAKFFEVDPDTKRRQAYFIVLALVSLVFTGLLYFGDATWLIPAVASYVLLAGLIYRANKRVRLVPVKP